MKHVYILALLVVGLATAVAQGTVNFANLAPGVDAPVFWQFWDARIEKPFVFAQLWAGPNASSLDPVGDPVHFRTGTLAGYFLGGARAIDSVAPGALAHVQIRVWDGSCAPTYDQARSVWLSTPGCGSIGLLGTSDGMYWDGTPGPSTLVITTGMDLASAANLVGLDSFSLGWSNVIPEPSIPALAMVGLAGALTLRGRRSGR